MQPGDGFTGDAEAEDVPEVVSGMSVVDQLEEFLRANQSVAPDPLAAAAMALAKEIDAGGTVAQSAVAFQKLMVELRAMVPVEKAVGKLDELQKRRATKLRKPAA